MSEVRMCDNCGNVFSVNETGWREYTETQNAGDSRNSAFNNSHNHGAVTRHIGPCCNGNGVAVVRPRIAMQELESGTVDTGYQSNQEREDNRAYEGHRTRVDKVTRI